MRRFTAKTADPATINEGLLHGGGAVGISGLFSPDQRRLLGLNDPYANVLETVRADNTEGRA